MEKNASEQISALIETVYAMAAGELPWAQLAEWLTRTFEATSAAVQIGRSTHGLTRLTVSDNFQGHLQLYQEYFRHKDVFVQRALKRAGIAKVVISTDLLTDSEFLETEFYLDWCRHLEIFHLVGAVFPTADQTLGVLGVHRARQARRFDELDRHRVSIFLPHLERAVRVWQQLGIAQTYSAMAAETLDRSDLGVLLLSSEATVLYANLRAESLLRRCHGLKYQGGKLSAEQASEADKLIGLIKQLSRIADRAQPSECWLRIHGDGGCIHVLAAPFRRAINGYPAPSVIAFLLDPTRAVSAATAARSLYQLTPTEAAIAEALVNGKNPEEIAAKRGAQPQTVRKQIKSLLQKTGTRRQAECAALLLRSVTLRH